MKRILLLGGTKDAKDLVALLSDRADFEIHMSLAGRTKAARQAQAGSTTGLRIGGFGGVDGLVAYLRDQNIDILLDATHPFAKDISWNAYHAARQLGIDHLQILREAWQPEAADTWLVSPTIGHAVEALEAGKRYLLAIGRQEAHHFARRDDCWFLTRSIEPAAPHLAVPRGACLLQQPTGGIEEEQRLLERYEIDAVICKNSGGQASYGKIVAARHLGLIVHMIERPTPPPSVKVSCVNKALRWLNQI